MATLQFKDDCDSMKVGLLEFDSSWTWQANELRATGAVTVSCSQVPQVLRRLNSRAAKALCDLEVSALLDGIGDILVGLSGGDALGLSRRATFHSVRGEGALQQDAAHFRGRDARVHRPYFFLRRFETKRQYPEEKADSSRMKVRSLRTSAGIGEVKMQKIESLQSRVGDGPRRGRRDYFKSQLTRERKTKAIKIHAMANSCGYLKASWPELLGVLGTVAEATIEHENNMLNAVLVKEGSKVTMEYRCDRVRVWVDANGIVTKVPIIG
ncbi:hypothetical protein GIB67_039603 [Kingdonia uniflora]|uniref:Uncharacterized protein n=1 Tax=Kingdonia uniflora TaxID=39325 RepID=A0A7J7P6I3_9MAGN|nr:hypothetical protein GIB67_039603 [Kingdonia uniflora]